MVIFFSALDNLLALLRIIQISGWQ